MGKSRMISIVRAQVARTNTHELDAHMSFMIHGTYIMRATTVLPRC